MIHDRYQVTDFREDILTLLEGFGKAVTDKVWCTLIVIRDISDKKLTFYTLQHLRNDGNPIGIANLLSING